MLSCSHCQFLSLPVTLATPHLPRPEPHMLRICIAQSYRWAKSASYHRALAVCTIYYIWTDSRQHEAFPGVHSYHVCTLYYPLHLLRAWRSCSAVDTTPLFAALLAFPTNSTVQYSMQCTVCWPSSALCFWPPRHAISPCSLYQPARPLSLREPSETHCRTQTVRVPAQRLPLEESPRSGIRPAYSCSPREAVVSSPWT